MPPPAPVPTRIKIKETREKTIEKMDIRTAQEIPRYPASVDVFVKMGCDRSEEFTIFRFYF